MSKMIDTTTATVLAFYKETIPELYKGAAEASLLDDPHDWDRYVNIYKEHQPRVQFSVRKPVMDHVKKTMLNHSPHGQAHFPIREVIREDVNSDTKMLEYGFVYNSKIYVTRCTI